MYVITEWIERYEVNDKGQPARKGDKLRVSSLKYIRSKVHGRSQGAGFARLQEVAKSRAYEVFGIFQKFLEIAGCGNGGENRGKLLNEKGNPASDEELAFILRTTEKKIAFALKILCSPSVKWLNISPNEKKSVTTSFQEFQEFQERKNQKHIKDGDIKTALARSKTKILKENSQEIPEIPGIPGKSGVFLNSTQHNTTQHSVRFDYENRTLTGLTDQDYTEWIEAFPAVDVRREIKSACQWLVDNPTKRKKQVRRFLTNWLRRQQERGGSKNKQQLPYKPPPPNVGPDGKTPGQRLREKIEGDK